MKGNRALTFAVLLLLTLGQDASAQIRLNKRLFMGGLHQQAPQRDDSPMNVPRVFWKNCEFLDVTLASGNDHSLSFTSPLFEDALQLRSSELSRVEFPTTPASKTMPTFCLLLKNGDRFFADITRLEQDTLVMDSGRHGSLRVPLASVQTITRLKGGQVLYQGPQGAEGWKHSGLRDAQGFPWTGGERGTMITRVWNRSAMLELPLPDKVQIDLVLSSSAALRFALCLKALPISPRLTGF